MQYRTPGLLFGAAQGPGDSAAPNAKLTDDASLDAGGPVMAFASAAALFRLTFFLRRAAYTDYEKSAGEG